MNWNAVGVVLILAALAGWLFVDVSEYVALCFALMGTFLLDKGAAKEYAASIGDIIRRK